jgi:hypothetical protein
MATTAPAHPPIVVAEGTPPDVEVRDESRVPEFDPQAGVPGSFTFPAAPKAQPPHRLVVIGDSLSHGFQSGAIYNTDISYPAIIAYELGWFDDYRYPTYGGPGGLPLNIEYLLRDLERRYGEQVDWWEIPGAVFHGRALMDQIEDYWERGAGSAPSAAAGINHDLSVYGWDLRDALSRSYNTCVADITAPKDDLVKQVVQSNGARAALRVYPSEHPDDTLFDAAARLGADAQGADAGIETLIVFLGANNALQTVTKLKVAWSGDDYQDLKKKGAYTVWRPTHFEAELDEVVKQVEKINARHVIWCTVPHVTVPPISRGIGQKLRPGSRYFPYYTRPWVDTARFDPRQDPCITGDQARAIDSAIDQYNDAIVAMVAAARKGPKKDARDWLVLDVAGLLDRLASRRYIEDVNARPSWWSQYPLPGPVAALKPTIDSRFLAGDGKGGRSDGGLFSLDGVHPTTVAYGMIAQELITIMRGAGVVFRHAGDQSARSDPVTVDFDRLIRRDSLVRKPPQNLTPGLKTLGWADEALDLVRNAVHLGP